MGSAIRAAAERLAQGEPDSSAIAAAFHALASAAHAALVLIEPAGGASREELTPLELKTAGDDLGHAELILPKVRRAYDLLGIKRPT